MMHKGIIKHPQQINCEMNRNEIKSIMWCVIAGVLFAGIGIFLMIYRMESEDSIQIKDANSIQATRVQKEETVSQGQYLVRLEQNKVCIYQNSIFYDYADIDIDSVSKDLYDMLEDGITLLNEQELYDFLQTYSS